MIDKLWNKLFKSKNKIAVDFDIPSIISEDIIEEYLEKNKYGVLKESLQFRNINYWDEGFLIEGQVTDTKRIDKKDPRSDLYEMTVEDRLGIEKKEYKLTVPKNHSRALVKVRDFVRVKGKINSNDLSKEAVYVIHTMEDINRNSDELDLIFGDGSLEEAQAQIDDFELENEFLLQGPITEVYRTHDEFAELVQLEMYDELTNHTYIVDTNYSHFRARLQVGDVIRVEGWSKIVDTFDPLLDEIDEEVGTHYSASNIYKFPLERTHLDIPYGSYDYNAENKYTDCDYLVEGKISNITKSQSSASEDITIEVWADLIQKSRHLVDRNIKVTFKMKSDHYMLKDLYKGKGVRLSALDKDSEKWIKNIWEFKNIPSSNIDISNELPPIQEALANLREDKFLFEGPITKIIRTRDIFAEIIYVEIFDHITNQDYIVEVSSRLNDMLIEIELDEEVRIEGFAYDDWYSAWYLNRLPKK